MKMLLKPRWAFLAVVAVAAWEGYTLLKPQPPPLDDPRRQAAEEACWQAVEELPRVAADGTVAILHLEGDETGYVTERLRAIIERTGTYSQPQVSLVRRVMKDIGIDESSVATLDDALRAGRGAGTTHVLFGRVSEFVSGRDTGRIRMELTVANVETGQALSPVVRVPAPEQSAGAGLRWYWRVPIWLAACLLLPLVTLPLVRAVLELESNLATLALLVVYSLAGWVLAFALAGFAIAGWLAAIELLLAFVAAMVYNCFVFRTVEERR